MSHRLDPLLRPGSIAVLGATERPHTVGRRTIENLLEGRYDGALYAVNPGRESVCGVPCYPSLDDLPGKAEHVIFAVSDQRIEAALQSAIDHGAAAATIMSSLVLEDDTQPALKKRIEKMIRTSGILVCGANGMGFYNFRDGVWACGFDTRTHRSDGNVVLISHSGSGMAGIVDVDERINFGLAVSTGQELCVSMDEYVDFALEQGDTSVIGLFMETVRHPERMRRVLQKANERYVPVVALKVGRTELAARLTVSHSGAIAGEDAAYDALFDHYGVQRVDDMDELATALILFDQPRSVGPGGLVAIHDSGGERQLMIDLAETMNVPLTEVSAATVAELDTLLDPGLVAVNPLDAWSVGGENADETMAECLSALMRDANAAIGAVVHDRAPGGEIYEDYLDYLYRGHDASGKPACLVANRQGTGADPLVARATREGFPVLDGLRSFLAGVRCLFGYRDFKARPASEAPRSDADVDSWRSQLATGTVLGESDAGRLLAEFGVPVNESIFAGSTGEALAAAAQLGFPVVLKTAAEGVHHRTDVDGIHLDLVTVEEVSSAYEDLAARLGPNVLVSPMVTMPGVEMMLGMVRDEQFGPLVVMGFGGIHIETIRDVVHLLPPFDARRARERLSALKLWPLLQGTRGRAPAAVDAFCDAAARFSVMAASLGDVLEEVDVNPMIVGSDRCVAVDALVVGHALQEKEIEERQAG